MRLSDPGRRLSYLGRRLSDPGRHLSDLGRRFPVRRFRFAGCCRPPVRRWTMHRLTRLPPKGRRQTPTAHKSFSLKPPPTLFMDMFLYFIHIYRATLKFLLVFLFITLGEPVPSLIFPFPEVKFFTEFSHPAV